MIRQLGDELRETTHFNRPKWVLARLQRRTRCCGDPEAGSNQGNGRRARCAHHESAGQCRWISGLASRWGKPARGRRRSWRQARRFPPVSRRCKEAEATWQSIFVRLPSERLLRRCASRNDERLNSWPLQLRRRDHARQFALGQGHQETFIEDIAHL